MPCTFTFVLCTTSHTRTDATHIDDFDTQVIALFALEAPHKRHQRGNGRGYEGLLCHTCLGGGFSSLAVTINSPVPPTRAYNYRWRKLVMLETLTDTDDLWY